MTNLNAYINFTGNCTEAMNFYKEALNADLELMKVGDSPMAEHMPTESHNQILHSTLSKDGKTLFMASDSMGYEIKSGDNVSICISGDLEEVKDAYAKLSEGGKVLHELKEEFFGTFGDIQDKFGVRWMFESDVKPQV